MLINSALDVIETIGGMRVFRFINRHVPRILMYHRILPDDIHAISPAVFADQMAYLKQHFRVISVNQLVEELCRGQFRPYTVALTFDDGHEDFYSQAWPILQRYDLPASLYVTTGFIDRTCWLWPDLLRFLVNATNAQQVSIEALGNVDLTEVSRHGSWNRLGDYCLMLSASERMSFLNELAIRLRIEVPSKPLTPFAPVTWDQLRQMKSDGLDVGSHSVSHPIFSALTKEELYKEIVYSQKRVAEELGEIPLGICYPNGMANDISPNVEVLAQQFYKYGLVAYPCGVSRNQLMHLGRWAAPNTFSRFKQMINSLSRNDNHLGEYR
jgi:peptidoglycan/xylan/chitin deacetylase (PgdA/CDA1 family)